MKTPSPIEILTQILIKHDLRDKTDILKATKIIQKLGSNRKKVK